MEAFHKVRALMGITETLGSKTIPVARSSKHAGGRRRPRGWHTMLRRKRKAKKAARRAQREQ